VAIAPTMNKHTKISKSNKKSQSNYLSDVTHLNNFHKKQKLLYIYTTTISTTITNNTIILKIIKFNAASTLVLLLFLVAAAAVTDKTELLLFFKYFSLENFLFNKDKLLIKCRSLKILYKFCLVFLNLCKCTFSFC
jgi:uncharacterized membrane protein